MNTEMTYRKTFAAGASPIGMLIALFDTLVGNFSRAAAAIRNNDIEARCQEVNHALLVLGHLDNWIDMQNGGESARNLSAFYSTIRIKMFDASVKMSPELFEELIAMLAHVRSSWQAKAENEYSESLGESASVSAEQDENMSGHVSVSFSA